MGGRIIFFAGGLLFGILSASAESHPAWWRYASPDATALVGIQWEHLRSSPFAEAISGELSGDGSLGFPDLECVKDARQILISSLSASPAVLAVASGNFPAPLVREQATRKGLKRAAYREVEIWVTPGKETLSLARLTDQLVLLGRVKNLQDAIDRNLGEESERAYSPLLARAARYAQDDLWVVAARLPDPLAEVFVPIEAEAEGFEGGVSLQGGLRLAAVLSSSSEEAAAQLAETLRQMAGALPPVARGIQIGLEESHIILTMAMNPEQLVAGLKSTPETASAEPRPAPAPVAAKSEPPKPAGPQMIRILGLDDGPREIVLR